MRWIFSRRSLELPMSRLLVEAVALRLASASVYIFTRKKTHDRRSTSARRFLVWWLRFCFGICLLLALMCNLATVHAYIVCDNDNYFFKHIDEKILPEMGAPSTISSRQFLQITNAQGTGYARSTTRELEFITDVSRKTGILMDPVYSGKALYHLIRELNESPEVLYQHFCWCRSIPINQVACCSEICGEIHSVCTHRRPVWTFRQSSGSSVRHSPRPDPALYDGLAGWSVKRRSYVTSNFLTKSSHASELAYDLNKT